MKYSMGKCALGITKNPSIDDFFSGLPIRASLDVSFSSPTTVDIEPIKHKSHPCEFLPEAEVNPSTRKTRRGDFFYTSRFFWQ